MKILLFANDPLNAYTTAINALNALCGSYHHHHQVRGSGVDAMT